MKKILLLCLSVLFTNFLMAQSITANTSSPNTEVGIANTFNFTLNPGTSAGKTHYRIDNWLIIANINSGTREILMGSLRRIIITIHLLMK